MLWVAAAGPLSNFAMALFWALMFKVGTSMPDSALGLPFALMGAAGVFFNIIIMVLNLVPLPPLDGGRIVVSLLPHRLAWRFARIEPYGFLILIILLFTGVLGYLLWPAIAVMMALVALLFGVSADELVLMTGVV
jgi:Zn-dependent protease